MGKGLGALGLGGPMPSLAPKPVAITPVGPKEGGAGEETPKPKALTSNGNSQPAKEKEPVAANSRKAGLLMVPITAIAPNPYQPRKYIDPDILAELSQSIRENGLIQPPVVSYNPDYQSTEEDEGPVKKEREAQYLLIAGERRWQASKLAGFTEIPVVLKEATPLQMLELALVENIQRADLNPLEEAEAYQQLMKEFKLTQEAVAQRVGKSRAAVANSLRLFDLPEDVLQAVYKNFITEGHARALLMVHNDGDKRQLLKEIVAKQYSVRQTEEMARRLNAIAVSANFPTDTTKPKLSPADRETRDLEEQFREALKTQVNLSRSQKGGKLSIQFNSDEELDFIFNKIVGTDI